MRAPQAARRVQALKPYLLLAAGAFCAGFVGYAGLGRPAPPEAARPAPPRLAAPASIDWSLPKHV